MNEMIDWLQVPAAIPDETMKQAAITRQQRLTKPPGALGRLEDVAILLAALQQTEQPAIDNIHIVVFAGDHGICEEGVSAFPQAVTAEMVRNFSRGGAAISVLAKQLGAKLEVINLGTVAELEALAGVFDARLGPGTANFANQPAMDDHQLSRALASGRQSAERAKKNNAHLYIGGEMGIGNTTSAAALACALLDTSAEQLAGPGTGLDSKGVQHKAEVIKTALALHQDKINSPLDALRYVGGFEIAALTGAYLACAQMGVPVLVDGFISSVAALCATKINKQACHWFLFSHQSAEPGHRKILQAMQAEPLLDLGMRLGEGSGAATAVPLLQLACQLHNGMATFAEASVSEKIE